MFLAVGAFREAWAAQGFPETLSRRRPDALVDREGLTQTIQAFAVVAVLDVGPTESFEGACFFWGCADVAGDGQRPGVVLAGVRGVGGPGG